MGIAADAIQTIDFGKLSISTVEFKGEYRFATHFIAWKLTLCAGSQPYA
jgi:hypothetical protein